MNKLSLTKSTFLGTAVGITVTGITSLGNLFAGLPFAPFILFDWLARLLHGPLITWAIDAMVAAIRGLDLGPTSEVAKLAEQAEPPEILACTGCGRRWAVDDGIYLFKAPQQ